MANTAALLGNLLCTNADIKYYTQQEIFWSGKYEANSAKLAKQVKYETAWESAFDSAMNNTKELTCGGVKVAKENQNERIADQYAHAKVDEYNEELSLELAELDMEYDTMKCMYESLLEQMRAQQDGEKTAVSNAAKDTGLLNAG